MRIYMVMTLLAPIGGIESALIPLCRELKALGHEVIVYVINPILSPNQNADLLRQAGIKIITTPPLILRAVPSLKGGRSRLKRYLRRRYDFDALYYFRLKSCFRRSPPAVIHVHGWGCGEDPPAALCTLRRLPYPIVYTEHNSPDPMLTQTIPDAPMNLADVLIAVSQAGKSGLIDVGQAQRPIVVIPYGIEPLQAADKKISKSNSEFVIGCIARLHPQKGHKDLIEAMARVVRVLPHARLLLAGEGALFQELQAKVRDLNLQERVEFVGVIRRTDLPAFFARTDVIVLASYWEGLPVSLMEAMSAGKAIVASRVGGNPELVAEGDNGLLAPAGDINALSQRLIQLGQNPDLVRKMGESSRLWFEQSGFSPRETALATLKAYELAIEERRRESEITGRK